MYRPPTDLQPERTRDGSLTLRSASLNAQYHSRHGAVQESTHVFIKAGLEYIGKDKVDVLEVGLGTGLNLLLTWIRCLEGKLRVHYTALEPHPVSLDALETLRHCEDLAWPGLHEPFLERMQDRSGAWCPEMGGLTFRQSATSATGFNETNAYDVIYFDAFEPIVQPELWTEAVFERMYAALRPGGILVTYCAKGDVRRAMKAVGFKLDRLEGPPGKREMVRAKRPL